VDALFNGPVAGLLDALFNGLGTGAVLLIAALGLAIVYGLMGVINMAHGELIMLGAYATFMVQNLFKPLGEAGSSLYIFLALPAAFMLSAAMGWLLEKTIVSRLYGRPLDTLLATWGVSLILQQFVRSISWSFSIGLAIFAGLFLVGLWALNSPELRQRLKLTSETLQVILGLVTAVIAIVVGSILSNLGLWAKQPWFGAQNVDVTAPPWLRGGVALGSLQFPFSRLFIIVLTVLAVFGLYWFLQKSPWGLRIRAVTQNRAMSDCLGIPTKRVDAITFAIGSGLAGLAGTAVALLGSVGPNTGQNYIVDCFMVVVVGGVGNLWGSVIAALALGTINYIVGSGVLLPLAGSNAGLAGLIGFFSTTSMAKALLFALIIIFLQFRPAGLFPPKGRTVD
jgi:urea transport system permease protein